MTVFVDADLVGGLPRPYPHPTSTKSMLSTLRFKSDCFTVGNRRLRLANVRALLIACDRKTNEPSRSTTCRSSSHDAREEAVMSDDSGARLRGPRQTRFRLPKVIDIEIRRTRFEAPGHRNFESSLPSRDDAVEFIVRTDLPIPVRALGPALYVGSRRSPR